MKSVKNVSDLTGVSIRTLHYYDEIGLLKPSRVNGSGYRMYDDNSLEILRHILLFKEVGFSLNDIKNIISNPKFDLKNSLKEHKNLLLMKRNQIDDLIWLLERLIEGEKYMSFDDFKKSEIEKTMMDSFKNCMNKYREYMTEYYGDEKEVEERYKKLIDKNKDIILENVLKYYGSVSAYNEALKKGIDPDNISENYQLKVSSLIDKIAKNRDKGIESNYIQRLIEKWQIEIQKVFRVKTKTIIFDIGQGYLTDKSLISQTDKKYGIGTAEYIGRSICYFCKD